MMAKRMLAAIGCFLLLGCPGEGAQDAPAARTDTLTRAERDSILGQSQLPGADAVRRALETSRIADDRAAQLDSIR